MENVLIKTQYLHYFKLNDKEGYVVESSKSDKHNSFATGFENECVYEKTIQLKELPKAH